jgi:hypothetical protein
VAQVRSWAGFDVHAAKIVAATVDGRSGELRFARLAGSTSGAVEFCRALPGPVKVAYEAGPTGFGLARELAAAGIECVIAAPGKIARAPQDRVKTDRRDAERLVRLLMAGELHPVRVPSTSEEALRDLVRAREDLRGDLMRARHRVGKLLLRHDLRFDGNNWTQAHRDWLARIQLSEPVAQAVLEDGLGAIDALIIRRESLERQMTALVPDSPWVTEIARLRCRRRAPRSPPVFRRRPARGTGRRARSLPAPQEFPRDLKLHRLAPERALEPPHLTAQLVELGPLGLARQPLGAGSQELLAPLAQQRLADVVLAADLRDGPLAPQRREHQLGLLLGGELAVLAWFAQRDSFVVERPIL